MPNRLYDGASMRTPRATTPVIGQNFRGASPSAIRDVRSSAISSAMCVRSWAPPAAAAMEDDNVEQLRAGAVPALPASNGLLYDRVSSSWGDGGGIGFVWILSARCALAALDPRTADGLENLRHLT